MPETPERDPLAGQIPEMLQRYGVQTSIGRTLRKGDAKLLLRGMDAAEDAIAAEELGLREVRDRLERIQTEQKLNLEYLLKFGVRAAERHEMRSILREVVTHGGLDLRESARLAYARFVQGNGDPGEFDGGNGESPPPRLSGPSERSSRRSDSASRSA